MKKTGPGRRIPGTPIAVDLWHQRDIVDARFFFLTHCHSDHMAGLNSQWRQPIYCSEITAKLLPKMTGVDSKFLRPLSLGSEDVHTIILDSYGAEKMTVQLFDAHHCPGAVMFLFEGGFGRVLFTGDFRYEGPVLHCPRLFEMFHNEDGTCEICSPKQDVFGWQRVFRKFNSAKIDQLYLDTTYLGVCTTFPSRSDALHEICEHVKQHISQPAPVLIPVRKLGKEDLLLEIARATGENVYVSQEQKAKLDLLGFPDYFTCELGFSPIITVPFHSMCFQLEQIRSRCSVGTSPLLIVPSALGLMKSANSFLATCSRENIVQVHFSDHSSHEELLRFLANFSKPIGQIIPLTAQDENAMQQLIRFKSSSNSEIDCMYVSDEYASPMKSVTNKSRIQQAPVTQGCGQSQFTRRLCRRNDQPLLTRQVLQGVHFDASIDGAVDVSPPPKLAMKPVSLNPVPVKLVSDGLDQSISVNNVISITQPHPDAVAGPCSSVKETFSAYFEISSTEETLTTQNLVLEYANQEDMLPRTPESFEEEPVEEDSSDTTMANGSYASVEEWVEQSLRHSTSSGKGSVMSNPGLNDGPQSISQASSDYQTAPWDSLGTSFS